MRVFKALRGVPVAAVAAAGLLLVVAGVVMASGSSSPAKVCVASKAGKPVLSPGNGVCKKGYTLTKVSVGATGLAGATGPAGAQGPQGPASPQGPAGDNGMNGTNGATGATGATGETGDAGTPAESEVMAGSIGAVSMPAGGIAGAKYLAGSGLSTPSSTESSVSVGSSAVATTARNLFVSIIGGASPIGQDLGFGLFVNGTLTSLRCNLDTGVHSTCSETTDTADIPAGATVSLVLYDDGAEPVTLPRVLFGYEEEG